MIRTRQQNINNLDYLTKPLQTLEISNLQKISDKVFKLKWLFENTLPVTKITQCHFICPANGIIETKLYTSQSENETNTDTIEQDEIMEEDIEPDSSHLPQTAGQIVAVYFHGKKQNIPNFYTAMLSLPKLKWSMNKENFDWKNLIICWLKLLKIKCKILY